MALAKGIDFVNNTDPATYQDELAKLFPKAPVEASVAVTNQFRSNGMWTSPVIPSGGYDRWQLGLRDARLVSNPIPYETLVDSGPALAAQTPQTVPSSSVETMKSAGHIAPEQAKAVSSAA